MSVDEDFATAARGLLQRPLLDRDDPVWAEVVSRRSELVGFFEELCGWNLYVDARAGVARLHKRTVPDASRPLRRRGDGSGPETAMRPEGYAILMLAAAELVTRSTTTIGELAENLAAASLSDSTLPSFDPTVAAHRRLLVDAVEWFAAHRLLTITAGAVEGFQDRAGDAVLVAEVSRFSRILSTVTPPSRLDPQALDFVDLLAEEPRYRAVHEGRADTDSENRYARHMLGRAVLDNPALLIDELDDVRGRYLTSPSGRRVLQHAAERVGFVFEQNTDCVVAVDASGEASDQSFGRSTEIATQVAVAILELLCPNRVATTLPYRDVELFVAALLGQDAGWAVGYQKPGGASALTERAVDILDAFGLTAVENNAHGRQIVATAVAGRFVTTVIDSRRGDERSQDATHSEEAANAAHVLEFS